jgi:hypothetical protein
MLASKLSPILTNLSIINIAAVYDRCELDLWPAEQASSLEPFDRVHAWSAA